MFESGSLPRSYATTKNDDQVTWIQQGRAAFTVLPFARFAQLNNPEQSKYPGKIKAIEFPVSAEVKGKMPMSSMVEAWGMVIPENSHDKELAWKFIARCRASASRSAWRRTATDRCGSDLCGSRLMQKNPVAAVEATVLTNARGAFPPFPEAARAQSTFLEEVQLAVLGRKPVKEAVAASSACQAAHACLDNRPPSRPVPSIARGLDFTTQRP